MFDSYGSKRHKVVFLDSSLMLCFAFHYFIWCIANQFLFSWFTYKRIVWSDIVYNLMKNQNQSKYLIDISWGMKYGSNCRVFIVKKILTCQQFICVLKDKTEIPYNIFCVTCCDIMIFLQLHVFTHTILLYRPFFLALDF